MSLYGSMRTAISGMDAQSSRLGTVSDNIANSGTTGYKRASVEFSSLVLPNSGGSHTPGGVVSNVRHAISEQGTLDYTTSTTDLAIEGSGFFVVSDGNGGTSLTRAGAFVPDAAGNLVNAAGYQLMGHAYSKGGPELVANGFNGLEPIELNDTGFDVSPSTQGTLAVNLPSEAEEVGPAIFNQPPSENTPYVGYNHKMSAVTSSASGDLVYTDVYFTKLDENTWEITAFDNYSGTPSGAPYDLESGDIKMGTTTLEFDPATGEIVSGDPVIVTDPADPVYLDFSELTQTLGGGASSEMKVNMNLPSDDPILDTDAGEEPASSNDPAAVFNSTLMAISAKTSISISTSRVPIATRGKSPFTTPALLVAADFHMVTRRWRSER